MPGENVLAGDSGHGYELKQALEQEFGRLLPGLNAGQIYSTLARLEGDGLIVGRGVIGDRAASGSASSLSPVGRR
jgi:DNA-binding PadR family transcriptional regulator